jgi:hypothetical protein
MRAILGGRPNVLRSKNCFVIAWHTMNFQAAFRDAFPHPAFKTRGYRRVRAIDPHTEGTITSLPGTMGFQIQLKQTVGG